MALRLRGESLRCGSSVRSQVGDFIRQEPGREPGQGGVVTVTGLLPSPMWTSDVSGVSGPQSPLRRAPALEADAMVTQLFRHTRSLLTRKGRPSFRLAG